MTASLVWPWWTGGRAQAVCRPEPGSRIELDNDPDAPLVRRCLRGDEAAWEGLVKSHTSRVYSICYRFTGRAEEAQDLTQEVFLRVFRGLESFDGAAGQFRTWLISLTRNLLIDHYRKTRKEKLVDSMEERAPALAAAAASGGRADSGLASREAGELLRAGLQRLSPDLREAVILRDLQEMEYREIAKALRVPDGTVKSRISRGRAELARALRKLGARL